MEMTGAIMSKDESTGSKMYEVKRYELQKSVIHSEDADYGVFPVKLSELLKIHFVGCG